jgi:subtilisin family serine protease
VFPRARTSRVRLSLAASAAALLLGASPAAASPVRAADGLRTVRPAASAAAPVTASAARLGTPTSAVPAAGAASAGDPRSRDQWAIQGDTPMGISSAWRQTTGAEVTVAIVDSGSDLRHPDLLPNLWTNTGETPGNGIDDDGNGYVDDVHGYDVIARDGDPQDENGHGTHVAGIVAARGGNGLGVAGVAWRARVMTVRVLDGQARGTTSTVAAGIRYAVDNGARVVNLSLAGPNPTPDLEAAVEHARSRGVLIVVAAGNMGADLAAAPAYPASYLQDNVLGVAATDAGGGLAAISDYGSGADIAAPGQDILSTALGGGYEWRTGTSMAAPQVTGALVLLAAARPSLDGAGLRDALLRGLRRTGLPVGAGALDVGAALRRVIPPGAWRDEAGAVAAAPVAASDRARSAPGLRPAARRSAKPKTTAKAKATAKTTAKATAKATAKSRRTRVARSARAPRAATAARRGATVGH